MRGEKQKKKEKAKSKKQQSSIKNVRDQEREGPDCRGDSCFGMGKLLRV